MPDPESADRPSFIHVPTMSIAGWVKARFECFS